jgi:hypothetical protein
LRPRRVESPFSHLYEQRATRVVAIDERIIAEGSFQQIVYIAQRRVAVGACAFGDDD